MYSSRVYDPSVTQLGHVDRNFMKFYAILCNFTTKKAFISKGLRFHSMERMMGV